MVLVDGVLFSGDVAMKPQPSFANNTATITHWLASLDELEAMKAKKIVPSHGPFGGKEIIEGYRAYLNAIKTRSAQLKKEGKSEDETVQLITDELSARYPDKNRPGRRDPRGLPGRRQRAERYFFAISARIDVMVAR